MDSDQQVVNKELSLSGGRRTEVWNPPALMLFQRLGGGEVREPSQKAELHRLSLKPDPLNPDPYGATSISRMFSYSPAVGLSTWSCWSCNH